MATRVEGTFCTMFRRSEAEKRLHKMGQELADTQDELDSVKKELAELKATLAKTSKK